MNNKLIKKPSGRKANQARNFNKEQLYNMINLACDGSRNLFKIQDSLIKDEE